MIDVKDFEGVLKKLGTDYFIGELRYVPDILSWAEQNGRELAEPYNPMKLIAGPGESLAMVMQEKIDDQMLADVIKNLGVRWSVKDNVTDMDKKLDSTKKRLVYCFLKEYARALEKTDGDELNEDEWVIDEMEYLDFFNE